MRKVVVATFAGLLIAGSWGALSVRASAGVQTAPKAASLGTIQLPRKVLADGKELAAGTYTLRLSTDSAAAVVGETPNSERWIEFMQGGTVKGREMATVLSKADLKEMKKPLAPGVEMLGGDKTDNYLRVWITSGGVSYLLHLVVQK